MERECSPSDVIQNYQRDHAPPRVEELPFEKPQSALHHSSSRLNLARSVAIVATCSGAMLVNTSNAFAVTIALPVIGKSVDIQDDQLQWLVSAYSLSSGCLLLFFGRLADLYGRKKAFLIGMFWQAVFALSLGFSSNGYTLDVLQGFQGMGAAAAIPASLGILAQSFPPSRARSITFATFAPGAPLGGAFGSLVGGVITQLSNVHWRALFFLAAGLSALCVIGGMTSFDSDDTSSEVDRRIDCVGTALVTGGLVLVVFVLGQGPNVGWKIPYIISCLVLGVILLGIFVAWEYYLEMSTTGPDKPKSFWTAPPLMKLSIWTQANGRMTAILVVAFLTWCGFTSWTLWVQLFYQSYLDLTPVLTMVRLIPMFVTGLLCNLLFGVVASKLALVVFIVSGTLITGFSSVLFALIDPSAPYWAFEFPSTVMVVFGADFVYAAGTLFVANVVSPHEQSLAGGLFQTMTQIGTAFGLTISTIVFNKVVGERSAKLGVDANAPGTNAPMSAKLQGYRSALWTSAAFPLLAALLAAIFLRKVGIVGHRKNTEQHPSRETIGGVDVQP